MAEPVRKSVYDVLTENFKIAKRRTFVHRFIYMCEHSSEEKVEATFTSVINKINNGYVEESVTGLLLIYPNYFIHLIDTCFWAYRTHLQRIFRQCSDFIHKGVILGFYQHINQRFFDEWGVRKATPPILLEKITARDQEEIKHYLQTCVFKVYNLCIELRQRDDPGEEQATAEPLANRIGEIVPFRMNEYLPEYNLIQFILNDHRYYSLQYAILSDSTRYDSKYGIEVWPIRGDYVPYTVFEQEVNPIKSLQNIKIL